MRVGGVTLGVGNDDAGRAAFRPPSAGRAFLALLLLPAALAGILLAVLHVHRPTPQYAGEVPAAPSAPATVTLSVARTTLRAGQPLRVTVSVVNHTNRTLRGGCAAQGWPILVLTGHGLPVDRRSAPAPCPPVEMPPGINRFHLTVATAYQRGASMTPLPAARYRLRVAPAGMPPGTTFPPAATITLTG